MPRKLHTNFAALSLYIRFSEILLPTASVRGKVLTSTLSYPFPLRSFHHQDSCMPATWHKILSVFQFGHQVADYNHSFDQTLVPRFTLQGSHYEGGSSEPCRNSWTYFLIVSRVLNLELLSSSHPLFPTRSHPRYKTGAVQK